MKKVFSKCVSECIEVKIMLSDINTIRYWLTFTMHRKHTLSSAQTTISTLFVLLNNCLVNFRSKVVGTETGNCRYELFLVIDKGNN